MKIALSDCYTCETPNSMGRRPEPENVYYVGPGEGQKALAEATAVAEAHVAAGGQPMFVERLDLYLEARSEQLLDEHRDWV